MDVARPAGIVRNITWLTAASVLVKPIWFVFITAVCMRILAAEGYGILNTAIWFTAIAAMVSDFGTSQYTVREVARRKDRADIFFSNILAARLVLLAVVWICTMGLAYALGYRDVELASLAAAGIYTLAEQLTEFARAFYRAFEVLRYESVSQVVDKIIVVALGTVVLIWLRTPAAALLGMALGAVVSAGLNMAWIHRNLARFKSSALNLSHTVGLLKEAFPLGLVNVFSIGFVGLGVVVLEMIGGEAAAGEYSAAYRIVEALQLLPMVVVAAVLPRLSALYYNQDVKSFRSLLHRVLAAVGAAALVAAGLLSFFSSEVISVLAASGRFENAIPLLGILAWAFPLISFNFMITAALVASDQHNFLVVVLGVGALVIFALNIALVPIYMAMATAYIFIGLQALIAIACYARYFKVIRHDRG